ncbi:MAG TPA: CDP-diacylglycerol--glycerol-3-phosphate 3-phosphatidyltransferase [Candidatus Paceibacterota bacterium]|nr:CDP-diacylglycerol--glycerol-3-phosphate 3-phosphatidyltransferase [Candidatus Paceibacterota bacterium]
MLPNVLTLFRGIATVAIIAVFLSPAPHAFVIAFVLFVFAAISDYLDGYLARRLGVTSEFGAVLDPLFDKVLVISLIVLIYPYDIVPAAVLFILIIRDITTDVLKNYLLKHGVVTPAIYSAKLKTAAQLLMLNFALIALAWPHVPHMALAASATGIAAAAFSLWSGGIYVCRFIAFTSGALKSSTQ